MARLLENYLETKGCRRRLLLSYFQTVDEAKIKQNKKCCDNCLRRLVFLYNFLRIQSFGNYNENNHSNKSKVTATYSV